VTLGAVALLSVVLLAVSAGGAAEESDGAWSSRGLLALGPIRPEKKGLHRHGRVEYRYLKADCTDIPPTTGTGTTVTGTTVTGTTPQTTSTTTPQPTTTTTTTTSTTTTTTRTTTTPAPTTTVVTLPTTTTRRPCPLTCPASSDQCFPNQCVEADQLPAKCQIVPVVCPQADNCTTYSCLPTNGTCVGFYNSSIPGCAAVIVGGGLSGGQIAGIVIGAVAAAAMAALLALWARRTPAAAPGAVNASTAPLAQSSPLYTDGALAGNMPAV
jgi:hypothetical protein